MSDLVELLNDLNQSNRIEYDDYSQLMFCAQQLQQLEEENEQLKQQIEKEKKFSKDVMNNELRLVKQIEKMKNCGNCKFSLECTGEHCDNCEKHNKWEW